MKWICPHCKAINPEFGYSCHNCGATNEVVNEALVRLSENLGIPFHELHLGLFFKKGSVAHGIVQLVQEVNEKQVAELREMFYKATVK